MSSARKLQVEVERLLKKCNEGIDVLDALWLKLNHVTNSYSHEASGGLAASMHPSHVSSSRDNHGVGAELKEKKEKYENDLKKEIKKMQRARDQIRTWQSSDIKISSDLMNNIEKMRRLIEQHMEKFKATEKMSKIKAFSSEALRMQAESGSEQSLRTNDPKYKTLSWINKTIHKLQDMRDVVDAEVEALQPSGVASGNSGSARQIEELQDRRHFYDNHVEKLEMVMRLINNDQVSTEVVDDTLKESFDYYVENYEDEGAMELLDESIYDDFSLDTIESQIKAGSTAVSNAKPSSPTSSDSSSTKEASKHDGDNYINERSNSTADTQSYANSSSGSITSGDNRDAAGSGKTFTTTAPMNTTFGKGTIKANDREKNPGSGRTLNENNPVPFVETSHTGADHDHHNGRSSHTPLTKKTKNRAGNEVNQDSFSVAHSRHYQDNVHDESGSETKQTDKQVWSNHTKNSNVIKNLSTTVTTPTSAPNSHQSASPFQQKSGHDSHHDIKQENSKAYNKNRNAETTNDKQKQQQQQQQDSLNDNQQQVQNTMARMRMYYSSCLLAAKNHIPTPEDLNINSPIIATNDTSKNNSTNNNTSPDNVWPPNPNPVDEEFIPESFPSVALKENQLPKILGKSKNLDTLFFCFYHQQGTYAQYVAAKELKRLGWRFHTGFRTWFQRYREPITLTDTYEESDMMFFDFYITSNSPGNNNNSNNNSSIGSPPNNSSINSRSGQNASGTGSTLGLTANSSRNASIIHNGLSHVTSTGGTGKHNTSTGWCQRLKKNFVFSYEYLEDVLV